MSVSNPPQDDAASHSWIANQPYLLLSITALCWAGNAIVGRLAAGHNAGDAFVPALVVRVPHHPAVCLEASGPRLARDPQPPRHHDPALHHRHRRVQYAAILG